jgi:uncharacterized protein
MKKRTVHVAGMHCQSCEILIEDSLKEVQGVRAVNVSHSKGTAEISYKGYFDLKQIKSIIEAIGYRLGAVEKAPFISSNEDEWNQLSKVAVAIVSLYFIGRWFGIFDLGNLISNNYSSLPIVFLIGLTAGVSTCMALVGGLVLGVSAKFAKQHPLATITEKFTPHLMFNLGRILTFVVLGGAIGWLGSILQVSMSLVGFLTILVGLSMLFLGLQLVEVFPRLSGFQFTLPKSISRALGMDEAKEAEYSHKNAAVLGGLTFFLPCGFTQAMQLFAMSTGSPLIGALTLGTFALGTAPGLLSIGGLASVVKGEAAKYFFKFAGLVVIALSFFNISNGLNLTGLKVFAGSALDRQEKPILGVTNDAKILKATYSNTGYIQPTRLTSTVGQLTRLEIKAEDSGAGCMFAVAIPGLTRETGRLIKGQTLVLEFTPQRKGTFPFVCTSMGMSYGAAITIL